MKGARTLIKQICIYRKLCCSDNAAQFKTSCYSDTMELNVRIIVPWLYQFSMSY